MITISEATAVEVDALATLAVDRPRQFRLRTSSESLGQGRRRPVAGLSVDDELLLQRNTLQRSASCSEVYLQRREMQRAQLTSDATRYSVKLRCRDEALCVRSKANVLRLVETVQKQTASSTSVLLAKKALKYRRLLDRAQEADLSDPTFDVAEFLNTKREGRTELIGFRKAAP